MKINLTNKNIPRNKEGDPAFNTLGTKDESDVRLDTSQPRVLDVFTPEEVVELVNRCLYQLEYQAHAHQKRRHEQEALERPVKEAFYELFPKQSYAKATDDQLRRCMEELRRQ